MNGENHWAKEWGVAFIRNQSSFVENHGNHHPSDCFGDIGAASGTVMLSIAAIGMQRGYLNSPALVSCSSDFGERAAVIVSST
jgi:3-oxoacyl-[acyl-carrier-protein] synthase-1